jgi:RimJ/RimL family protein N-acetyltransferase
VLRTRRLVLRPPRPADAPAIFARWDHDPEVYRYMHRRPATTVEQTDRWIRGAVEQRRRGTTLTWALTRPEDDRPLGVVALTPDGHEAGLGYVLARDAWGRGYATEAADAVVRAALALRGVSRVLARCDADNVASARVMEKVGMRHEGTLRRHAVRPDLGPEPRDTLVYARVR